MLWMTKKTRLYALVAAGAGARSIYKPPVESDLIAGKAETAGHFTPANQLPVMLRCEAAEHHRPPLFTAAAL
jgi:hypothetical protein